MEKVAKVVRSPAASDVFILSKDLGDEESRRFIIEDSPDSIPIKGMSFSVAPEGIEEEIAAWSVLSKGSSESMPAATVLWRWFSSREEIEVGVDHRLTIFQLCLWNEVPAFYWIQGISAARIREKLLETIRSRPNNHYLSDFLVVASFLGRGAYTRCLSAFGEDRSRLNPTMLKFPEPDARTRFGTIPKNRNESDLAFRKRKLEDVDVIASAVKRTGKVPALQKRLDAKKIDCFLFAQNDKYL